MNTKDEYTKDLKIDEDDLVNGWVTQPILYMKWSERWAEASKERDQLKENLEIAISDATQAVMKKPEKYGLSVSPTVKAIDSIVKKFKTVKKAQDEFNDAVHNARIMEIARTAFEHRRRGLGGLTTLFQANYWSKHTIPEGDQMVEQDLKDKMKESANKGRSLKRKPKKLVRRHK